MGLEPAALSLLLTAVLPQCCPNSLTGVSPHSVSPHSEPSPDASAVPAAAGGGRRRNLDPYQEVLHTLVYLRHNVAHAVVGQMFGVSADISENSFHDVVLLLRDLKHASVVLAVPFK